MIDRFVILKPGDQRPREKTTMADRHEFKQKWAIALSLLLASCDEPRQVPAPPNIAELPSTVDVLPSVAAIESMKATFYDSRVNADVAFDVPQDQWQKIFDALRPAEFDPSPAKWRVLGDLHVKMADRSTVTIEMFALTESPGAFASGTSGKGLKYYRGGDTRKLEAALRNAAAAVPK